MARLFISLTGFFVGNLQPRSNLRFVNEGPAFVYFQLFEFLFHCL